MSTLRVVLLLRGPVFAGVGAVDGDAWVSGCAVPDCRVLGWSRLTLVVSYAEFRPIGIVAQGCSTGRLNGLFDVIPGVLRRDRGQDGTHALCASRSCEISWVRQCQRENGRHPRLVEERLRAGLWLRHSPGPRHKEGAHYQRQARD